MALKLGNCGQIMKAAVDSLADEQKKDRDVVFKAMGDAIEKYIESVLLQVSVVVPPLPGLGTSTAPGSPTAPGVIAIIPPGSLK